MVHVTACGNIYKSGGGAGDRLKGDANNEVMLCRVGEELLAKMLQ